MICHRWWLSPGFPVRSAYLGLTRVLRALRLLHPRTSLFGVVVVLDVLGTRAFLSEAHTTLVLVGCSRKEKSEIR